MQIAFRTVAIATLLFTAGTLAGISGQANRGAGSNNQNDGNPTLPIQDQFEAAYPNGSLLKSQGSLRRVWGQTFNTGHSAQESVTTFMKKWSSLWGVPFTDLAPIGPFADGAHSLPLVAIEGTDGASEFTAVYFTQTVSGVPVFRSYGWGLVRNESNFPMVLAGGTLRSTGNLGATLAGRNLNASTIDAGVVGREALIQFSSPPVMSSPRYVIWAGIDHDTPTPRLAVEFTAEAGGNWDPSNHQSVQFVVDAADGTILHEESRIHHAVVTGNVKGMVTDGKGADVCHAEASKALQYAGVTVGANTVYADVNGNFTSGTVTGTVSVQPNLVGKYFQVSDSASGARLTVAAQNIATGSSGNFVFNATPTELNTAHTNAYREANIIRDFALAVSPSFPSVSTQTTFPVYVNIASTCNAYYDGSSINFYQSGGGCNNTAFSGVVHHEYGHHLVAAGGSGQQQYGEGMSDVMAMLTLDDPVLGLGFQSCAAGIRNADNTCQYSSGSCSSCGSEIHACGQLISGCVWDLRQLYGSKYPTDAISRVASLSVNSIPLHAGQSDIAQDITVDFLTLDDNDGNISNGTPNYSEIASAFGSHGLPAPALSLLDISLTGGAPELLNPQGGTEVRIVVNNLSATYSGSAVLRSRVAGQSTYATTPMTPCCVTNGSMVSMPSGTCGTELEWYVEAQTTTGAWVAYPSSAPATPNRTVFASGVESLLSDDAEIARGWTLNQGDTATTGKWVRGNPIGTTAQPESSHSPSNCYFTGQGTAGGTLGEADVDNGRTHLMSPTFDLAGYASATLDFWYWHSNNTGALPGEDPFIVQASSNNGSTWVQVASINTNLNSWAKLSYALEDFISLTSTVRVRFISLDEGAGGSLVESGIDDVTVSSLNCTTTKFGDLDGDGSVGNGDLALLLLDFGQCPGCPADLDESGYVDSGDAALLLLNYD